ncbi:MAG: YqaE/Pmp3 family membrane protein [Synechococcus sp.]
MTAGDILTVLVLAFFLPPLAVYTQVGAKRPYWINLVLWLLSFGFLGLPVLGILWPVAFIHAVWVILTVK